MKKVILYMFLCMMSLGAAAQAIKGDVNGDGTVNISDINAVIIMIHNGNDTASTADVNGDGVVNISDLNAIISIIIDGPSHPVETPNLYIEQDSLDLGEVSVGEARKFELTIVNNTMDSVTLKATIDSLFTFKQQDGDVSSMTITVPGNSRDTVTVKFKATTLGDFNGNVSFQSSALDEGKCVIPIHAIVILTEYIDLDLPSGTQWATRNVGADIPEDNGDYFAWGETTPKETYTWDKWCNGSYNTLTKYCTNSNYGTADYLFVLDPADDAACVNYPDGCMPTVEQIQELVDSCKWEWISMRVSGGNLLNGNQVINDTLVYGYKVTGPNENYLFLPAAGCYYGGSRFNVGERGYYWSLVLDIYEPIYARRMQFSSGSTDSGSRCGRIYGLPIRAVRKPQN